MNGGRGGEFTARIGLKGVGGTASTGGTTALTLEATEFALGPGESRSVKVWFSCSQTTSFTGTVRFQGSIRGGDQTIDIPVTGTIRRP